MVEIYWTYVEIEHYDVVSRWGLSWLVKPRSLLLEVARSFTQKNMNPPLLETCRDGESVQANSHRHQA